MSDDRTLDPAGIISEIVEIVADGDVDPLTRCSRYDPRICEGSLGTMQGYGALCAAHVAGLKTAPERIAGIRSWLTDHEDDTCLAEVSDDCVREYKPKYPRGTEDEVRRIAVGDMRVEKLDQLSRIVAAIAPQDEGELIPGLPAAFGQQNDLNAKLNRLKTFVLLRSAPKLREPTSNQRDAIAAELSDWQTMSESERTARIAKLLDDVKTLDSGAWAPYVEARAYLIRDADRNSAFRALLCLSQGLNPGVGVPDEWVTVPSHTRLPEHDPELTPMVRDWPTAYPDAYRSLWKGEAGRGRRPHQFEVAQALGIDLSTFKRYCRATRRCYPGASWAEWPPI